MVGNKIVPSIFLPRRGVAVFIGISFVSMFRMNSNIIILPQGRVGGGIRTKRVLIPQGKCHTKTGKDSMPSFGGIKRRNR